MKKLNLLLTYCCFTASLNYAQTTSSIIQKNNGSSKNTPETTSLLNSFPELGVDDLTHLYIKNTSDIKALPDKNPADGVFFLNSILNAKQTIQVYDSDGNMTLNQTTSGKVILDPDNLKKGIYNLTIKSDSAQGNKKVIIIVR